MILGKAFQVVFCANVVADFGCLRRSIRVYHRQVRRRDSRRGFFFRGTFARVVFGDLGRAEAVCFRSPSRVFPHRGRPKKRPKKPLNLRVRETVR